MKGHEASVTFHQKTWYQSCLVFMLLGLKVTTTKTYFLQCDTNIPPSATVEYLDSPSVTVNLLFPCMLPTATVTYIKPFQILLFTQL